MREEPAIPACEHFVQCAADVWANAQTLAETCRRLADCGVACQQKSGSGAKETSKRPHAIVRCALTGEFGDSQANHLTSVRVVSVGESAAHALVVAQGDLALLLGEACTSELRDQGQVVDIPQTLSSPPALPPASPPHH